MPKVIFKFRKENDLWNLWDTCNNASAWGYDFTKKIDPKIIELCKKKKLKEVKKKLEEYKEEIYSSGKISASVESFNKEWGKINNRFFIKLKELMKKPVCAKLFIGYLTTVGRCPYDFNKDHPSFFVVYSNKISHALRTAAHEIMHIQFHNTYWKKVEEQIGREKTEDLKEALTALLNLEFKDLGFAKDEGYPNHQELRKFIENEWKKEPDFDVLIKKCVKYLK